MTEYNRVALTRELPGDLATPVSTYRCLGNRPYTYLLESMHGGERWGRYSFIGLPAREVIRLRGNQVCVEVEGKAVLNVESTDPMGWLRAHTSRIRVEPNPALPRFSGGYVGYFGYDCVRYFEPRLKAEKPDPLGTPDVLLMQSDELVVFDSQRATLTLVVHADPSSKADLARAEKRLDQIEKQLTEGAQDAPVAAKRASAGKPVIPDFVSSFGEEKFKQGVERIKEYIAAGDVMQVVPSQRLSAPFTAEPIDLYRALRRLNPSPYLYCLHLEDHHVVGSSPEILVRVENGEVTVRPIAGTRVRGKTPEEDRALEVELLADPKELAEHLMLIDLGRNDVGRVAEVGSVKLTEKMVIERYSHVMHIVSNVTGKLKPGLDALAALAATFPAGTLSGAPKVRAMEIIDELEPVKRGIYGGAVGYLGWDGNMDTAIAIRTAVLKDGQLHVQAGAGIVADSDPQSEWNETMNKARAVMRAATEASGASS
ncbi:anthranilate synthase component I [Panacagrimonas perspica]|uniref:Anthranilate synthase component 1 n=1 Tax=Panacagrimonas perspica TaxID=381431 RepID=A0A4S3K9N3_9GAMM|nr:anthranilate synthase component I [Panacagrimonas perspica]TDU28687.1 anthranilate synthase component I [Panacagrimonas perspica]THD05013.1 anthranilate synthase component I [Panacagrimonas perspica]